MSVAALRGIPCRQTRPHQGTQPASSDPRRRSRHGLSPVCAGGTEQGGAEQGAPLDLPGDAIWLRTRAGTASIIYGDKFGFVIKRSVTGLTEAYLVESGCRGVLVGEGFIWMRQRVGGEGLVLVHPSGPKPVHVRRQQQGPPVVQLALRQLPPVEGAGLIRRVDVEVDSR